MNLGDLRSPSISDPREFSMTCFRIMELFHWTYDEVMNIPIPVWYALMEYLSKKE